MFRRLVILAAVAGAAMFVARKVGIIGGGEDEPIEYAPQPEAAPPEAPSADDGDQDPTEE